MVRGVRSSGVRVTEAEGADDGTVAHDRDDESGCRREFAMQLRNRTAGGAVAVGVNRRSKRGPAGSHDRGYRADQVVAPDAVSGDEHAHVAREVGGAVCAGNAAQRARSGEVKEAEISQTGKRVAQAAFERTASQDERSHLERM